MMPPTWSPWPLMYLVVECTTTSAPSSSGRSRYGVVKVLSTKERRPLARAQAMSASRSSTSRVGLRTVSRYRARVVGRRAASSAAGVISGRKVTSIFSSSKILLNRAKVPP